jgi:hypothetical protein
MYAATRATRVLCLMVGRACAAVLQMMVAYRSFPRVLGFVKFNGVYGQS